MENILIYLLLGTNQVSSSSIQPTNNLSFYCASFHFNINPTIFKFIIYSSFFPFYLFFFSIFYPSKEYLIGSLLQTGIEANTPKKKDYSAIITHKYLSTSIFFIHSFSFFSSCSRKMDL